MVRARRSPNRARRQGARVDQREGALAGQDEARTGIAGEVDEAADHVRSSSRNEC